MGEAERGASEGAGERAPGEPAAALPRGRASLAPAGSSGARSPGERVVRAVLTACGFAATATVVFIFLYLLGEALPPLLRGRISLGEYLGARWEPSSERFGLQPLLAGSLLVTALGTLIAIPFGVGGALYVAEFAAPRERELLKPFIEVLAGVPSVVLGFFGLAVLGPAIKALFGLDSSLTALTGAVLLAFMAVPTILSISEDALRAVPRSYRDASLALGATRWQTAWRVTLPAAASGVLAAVMLGVGRVIGETMAVLMCTGNSPTVTLSPFDSVKTMTAAIAGEMGDAGVGSDHRSALFMIGLLLLVITLGVNLTARYVVVGRGAQGAPG